MKIASRLGLGFGFRLGLVLGLGGNFPRGQLSYNHLAGISRFTKFEILLIKKFSLK